MVNLDWIKPFGASTVGDKDLPDYGDPRWDEFKEWIKSQDATTHFLDYLATQEHYPTGPVQPWRLVLRGWWDLFCEENPPLGKSHLGPIKGSIDSGDWDPEDLKGRLR